MAGSRSGSASTGRGARGGGGRARDGRAERGGGPPPEPLLPRLDEAAVGRVTGGDGPPIVLEMAAEAVAALQGQVHLLRPLQQVGVVPGRAVEGGRRARARRPGLVLLV